MAKIKVIQHLSLLLGLCLVWVLMPLPIWAEGESGGPSQGDITTENTAVLTFTEEGITEDSPGEGYTIAGTALTITKPGIYRLKGTCPDGSITVDGKKATGVTLVLDNLELASVSTAPILIKKNTEVTICPEGENTLTDAETDPDGDDYEGAAIKIKNNTSVTFNGRGKLTTRGTSKNGIKIGTSTVAFEAGTYEIEAANNGIASDAAMIFSGGTYTVRADKNGITAEDSLVFRGGHYTVICGNDAIKSVPEETDEESAGTITVFDGELHIDAVGDGIQAEQVFIHDGIFDIKTYRGYDTTGFDSDAMSAKGIKASGDRENSEFDLTIKGGTFDLNCRDDAIHSDGNTQIVSGNFRIRTGDDAVHADETLVLGTEAEEDPALVITVDTSKEGLEAKTIRAYSGTYTIHSKDDGMNVSSGSDRGFLVIAGCDLYIYGGIFYIDSGGDGMDSNGNIYLYGGTIEVFSNGQSADAPLDSNGTMEINGAKVMGAGKNSLRDVRPNNNSQHYLTLDGDYLAGDRVQIKAVDEILYETSLPKDAVFLFYSAPDLPSDAVIATPDSPNYSGGLHGGGGIVPNPEPREPELMDSEPTLESMPEVLFEDVLEGAYYFDPVKWAVQKDVTNGIDETHFGPDQSCTRAQMVTFLWRAAGSPEPAAADNPFTDVETGSYYEKAVLWAVEKGITTGTSETTFSPNATVTRGQSVTFLYRYDGQKADAEIPFEDVEDGAYYEEAVQWAVSEEITNGTSETTFEPDSPCTRGQIVTFLYRDLAE